MPSRPPTPTDPSPHGHGAAAAILRLIRAHRSATLVTPEAARPCPTIIDPATGRLVAALESDEALLDAATLFIPDESNDALQLLVLPGSSEPATDAARDRYTAFHGAPTLPALLSLTLDGARHLDVIVDASEIDLGDPFPTEAASIRRALNADRHALGRICTKLGIELGLRAGESPVALSVDPHGIDLKGPLGLRRYDFERPARDAADLRAMASHLLPFDPDMTRL